MNSSKEVITMKKIAILALVLFVAISLIGCAQKTQQNSQIANPASVYCEQQGGKTQIITAADGSQSGNCILANGTVCDEWAYFRKECPK